MKESLVGVGLDVHILAINDLTAVDYQDDLSDKCTVPLLQDSKEVEAWKLLSGAKDDFYFYRSDGTLAIHLPAKGAISTNLSTDEGYSNVEILLSTLK